MDCGTHGYVRLHRHLPRGAGIRENLIIASITLCLLIGAAVVSARNDQQRAALRFDPPVVSVVRDSTGFVQAMVRVYSSTGDTIRLTNIKGSCGCATASVQRPMAHDSTPARIYLAINAKHFTDSLNYVDYTIDHTGTASPASYRVVVRLPKDLRK